MYLFVASFISCNAVLSPLSIEEVNDIPNTLSQAHCPERSSLQADEHRFQCLDKQTGKRHGPYLIVTDSHRDIYFYENDELISFPWLTINGQLDMERTHNFLQQELSAVVLQEFINRYPTSELQQDLSIRIQEQKQSELKIESCTSLTESMDCIHSQQLISRLYEQDTTFLYVSPETQFLIDNQSVSQEDVALCQQRCQCSLDAWNSPKVSAEYCLSQQKRLPTLDELLIYNRVRETSKDTFELSAHHKFLNLSNFDVVYSSAPLQSHTGVNRLASSINGLNQYSHNNQHTGFRCAKDYSTSSAFDTPIRTKLQIPKSEDFIMHPSSWGAQDKNYQQSLKDFLRDSPRKTFDFSYKNIHMINEILWNYHQAYPDITEMYNFGVSNQNFPILGLRITSHPSDNSKKPSVLINAAHHGDELLSVLYALYNIEYTLEHKDTLQVQAWLHNLDLWFIPLVNPDGNWMTLHIHTGKNIGRKNGLNTDQQCEQRTINEGVDLNRNYPFQWGATQKGSSGMTSSHYYRGQMPASEPETQILMELANREKFVSAISWHTHGTMIISPYTIPGLKNPNPDIPWMVAEDLIKHTPIQPNGRSLVVKSSMYDVDGTDQDWHYHTHGTLAYIVEGSHHNPESIALREESVLSIHPVYTRLLDRIVSGPAVYGFVKTEDGKPIEATITIKEQSLNHEENWTTRKRDGLFYRLLPSSKKHTVQISAPGYRTQTFEIPASDRPINLEEITLQEA